MFQSSKISARKFKDVISIPSGHLLQILDLSTRPLDIWFLCFVVFILLNDSKMYELKVKHHFFSMFISRKVHDSFTWNYIHPLKNMIKKLNKLYNYIWCKNFSVFRYETTIYDGKTISQGHHQCSMFNKISIWDPARNAIPFPFVRL